MDYPSVTQVLAPFTDFSMIPPDVLQAAADRGSKVHAICAGIALGEWVPKPPPELSGYISSFRQWFKYVDKVWLVEEELVDRAYGFKGHPDLAVSLIGDEDFIRVLDLKTPATKTPTWAAQIAAYNHLVGGAFPGKEIRRSGTLRLRKDGRPPVLDEYQDSARDFQAFVSALTAWKYFKG